MSATDLYHRYEATWASQDWDGWLQTLTADYRFWAAGTDIGDREATLRWSRSLFGAFPDYRQRISTLWEATTADGERSIVAEAEGRGTSAGVALAPGQPAPVAGRTFVLPYVKVLVIADGLFRHDRQYHDRAAMAAALGA